MEISIRRHQAGWKHLLILENSAEPSLLIAATAMSSYIITVRPLTMVVGRSGACSGSKILHRQLNVNLRTDHPKKGRNFRRFGFEPHPQFQRTLWSNGRTTTGGYRLPTLKGLLLPSPPFMRKWSPARLRCTLRLKTFPRHMKSLTGRVSRSTKFRMISTDLVKAWRGDLICPPIADVLAGLEFCDDFWAASSVVMTNVWRKF